jgi:hypothetical protein
MRKPIALPFILGVFLAIAGAAQAECPSSDLQNGQPANADDVMAWLDCKAPLNSPAFLGRVGINTTPASTVSLHVKGASSGSSDYSAAFQDSLGNNLLYLRDDGYTYFGRGAALSMLIDQGGNVGVGIVTPQTRLDVNGGLRLNQANGGNAAASLIELSGRQTGWSMGINWNLYYDGTWRYRNSDYGAGVGLGDGTNQGDIIFATTPNGTAGASATINQRMRITNAGNVGIGTSSPGYTLHVNGSVAGTSPYNDLSDIRLKKNVAPITHALARIDRLQGVYFEWRRPDERSIGKSVNLPTNQRQIGFLAQDVRKIVPEAVSVANDNDRTMSVAESKIVPLLVEAVKELSATNRTLEKTVHAQSVELSKLRTDMGALQRSRLAKLN